MALLYINLLKTYLTKTETSRYLKYTLGCKLYKFMLMIREKVLITIRFIRHAVKLEQFAF